MKVISMVGMLVADTQAGKQSAEGSWGNASQGGGIVFVQYTEHFGRGEPLAFFVCIRKSITTVEHIFQRGMTIEGLVVNL